MGKIKPTILAMYSGGLDSLGMVYKLLTDPQYKRYILHIHHIHNKNAEHRDQAEAIAVNLALAELKIMNFQFEYTESEIVIPTYKNKFMFDTDTINFFAGYICSLNSNIESVAMGMNAGDANQSLENRRKRADAILAAFTPVGKIYPVLDMSKREIYDSLPDQLKNKFWSCRRPVHAENKFETCGKCNTCIKLSEQSIPSVNL
jgi:7-cyano-7-deazaguanine synthase in queuosine biosynthesis